MRNQMAPWVPLFIQSSNNNKNEKNPFTPFQFATVQEGPIGKPTVKTVVFRDFLFHDKCTNVLTFCTDLRNDKLCNSSPYFESCFYFPTTWEQYRFSGQWFILSLESSNHIETTDQFLVQHTHEEWEDEIMRQWGQMSRGAKSLYRKPAPGSPLSEANRKKLDKIQRGVDGAHDDTGLENFGLVCLLVDKVDYLNLKDGSGGERRLFERCTKSSSSNESNNDKNDNEINDDDDDDDDDNEQEQDDEDEDDDHWAMWKETEVCP
ncbi:similar to Saccharomyces cerevisiae YGR017W Putative protein of unknown function [Maudiozyma saulgeensis]|uniref:Pyridoxamine 5'-phosphate oxidase Alr4036 family FMN-binding domain-containing protein n=1 Tax=Maudiozyma saulgeensis TaxID=1789683 RepID=A0A1X7RA58_9SACH|nr:similar to Saccharomyces cerevisiae YGR017W Putative protein of unknown function [Kazachstania saulgeensis]